jgi:hypothetical protein
MPYKHNQDACIDGTSLVLDDVGLVPALLVSRFGRTDPGPEPKLSGRYVFTGGKGAVFTVYDWKATTRWEQDGIAPEELWAYDEPFEFHVGANEEGEELAGDFVRWLKQALALQVQ